MAPSTRNTFVLGIPRVFAALLLLIADAALGLPKPAPKPIDFTAQSSLIDYKNSFTTFKKVEITQGNLAISADQGQVKGTGVNFQDSHWIFRGAVKITVPQGMLSSDEAQVFFTDTQLARATASGKPATFQQKVAKADKTVNGHSDSIDYDAGLGIVHLTTDAYLTDGQNEIRGQSLKYNVIAQSLIADAPEQKGQRVHIIITPPPPKTPAAPLQAAPTPAPAPAPATP
jgi:lipopolysaccharide transport protein LptA